ncbi:cadherin repeat domain-containing protein [Bradyrhizobium sp. 137]|uniref:cadherin repeat domain-containing protein n=1 Tax=Bradyrhizobium sp. 137 TaxID=2782614 RepID=UPI001FF9D746|nr:cadherin repeat domain-containing protein [Bradyrhizobium sp. 137]MCK1753811.1 cadherin repeat domain-containing protein [Bradyrhizobium sp. 137]
MRFGVGVRFPVPGMISLVGKAFSRSRVRAASGGTTPLSGKATARWSWRSGLGSVPVITSTSFTLGTNPGFDALIGHVDATNSPTSYAITAGNPSGFFAIYSSGNMRTGLSAAPPDNIYNLTVTASNSFGTSPPKAISVTVGTAPVVSTFSFALSIPAAAGTAIGTVSASGGTPTTWAITAGNSAGYFAIDNSGLITVTSAGASGLTAQTYSLTVQATNALGSNTGTVTITASTGVSSGDGAANAPTGTAQFPNLLSGMAVRPPWNVAGVDYRTGINTGVTLKDPATISMSGVSVDTGSRIVTILGDNVTISGYDFSMGGGWYLNVGSVSQIGGNNATITNCKFRYNTLWIRNQPGAGNPGTTIRYCEFDGGVTSADANAPEFLIDYRANGDHIFEYNWIHNVACDIFSISSYYDDGTISKWTCRYNVWNDTGYNSSLGWHPDWVQTYGGAITEIDFSYNTCAEISGGGAVQGICGDPGGPWYGGTINHNTFYVSDTQHVNFYVSPYTPGSQLIDVHHNYARLKGGGFPNSVVFNYAASGPDGNFHDNVNMVTGTAFTFWSSGDTPP